MYHLCLGEDGQEGIEGIPGQFPVGPTGTVDCPGAVSAGGIAAGGDLDLYPVEPGHPLQFPPLSQATGKGGAPNTYAIREFHRFRR